MFVHMKKMHKKFASLKFIVACKKVVRSHEDKAPTFTFLKGPCIELLI